MSIRTKLLDRMEKLRKNFNTCEQGAAFWKNTGPLWNQMTQCLLADDSGTAADGGSESSALKMNADETNQRYQYNLTEESRPPMMVQQIMMNGNIVFYLYKDHGCIYGVIFPIFVLKSCVFSNSNFCNF